MFVCFFLILSSLFFSTKLDMLELSEKSEFPNRNDNLDDDVNTI